MQGRRIVQLLVLVAVLPMLTACSMDYWMRTQKPNINSVTKTEYSPNNYEVLGPVEAQGNGMIILFGVFSEGLDGQGLLMAAAQKEYGDEVTGLKDITSSSKWTSVLGWIYAKVDTTYFATAVKEI